MYHLCIQGNRETIYINGLEKQRIQDSHNKSSIWRPKPAEFLLFLENSNKNILRASVECDLTYSHAVKLMKTWEKAGLVRCSKEGRINYFQLTRRGQEIAETMRGHDPRRKI